jgi:MFS family permease
LALVFGALYFIQGAGEPTEGLIAQPVRSLLKEWGTGPARIGTFAALLAIPWSLKPLYGLLSDFVPIAGSRRRSYLVLASVATIAGLAGVALFPPAPGQTGVLLGWLLLPTVAIALADVATDALLVETAQPRGLTGMLQAVQWGCLYAATVLTGSLGGYLSQHHRQSLGFLICASLAAGTIVLAVAGVEEQRRVLERPRLRDAIEALGRAARTPGLWALAGFLFLWNVNPFCNAVLQFHMTMRMGFSEQFYGHTVSVLALASIAACVAYGRYSRRVRMPWLVHASIALGIASTLAYGLMSGPASAVVITIAVGLTYMTATLIQLDLAARACPTETAGTVFATLMALENLATSASTFFGSALYEWGDARWGGRASFLVLLGIGAATTASCWALVPLLPRTKETLTTEPCQ